MKSKKQFSKELADHLASVTKIVRSVSYDIEAFNECLTDNAGVINVLNELVDWCEITGTPLNIEAIRAGLDGKSLPGCENWKGSTTDARIPVFTRVMPPDQTRWFPPGQPGPEPLHDPWYGVYSKQLAASFLDGVLVMFFLKERHTRNASRKPRRQELLFS